MKKFTILLISIFIITSCKKSDVKLSANAAEIFWLSNNGADMPVWVHGNTSSKIMILLLHGGPGGGAYSYADIETNLLWKNYAFAYWDQRDAGSAAGNNNYSQLNFPQMVDDLKKLIQVIKSRYGNDMKVFLMGHSFGALLGTAYLTEGNNQDNIKAWIEVDGAHDYPQSYILESKMLIDSGTAEIARGRNVAAWTEIVNYCKNNPPNSDFNTDDQMDTYGEAAEGYFNIPEATTKTTNLFATPSSPLSIAANLYKMYYTKAGVDFVSTLDNMSYTNELHKIKIPALLLWGQYDFLVPSGCGETALQKLGSSNKKLVIMPMCGHISMNNNPELFAKLVTDFIEEVK